MRAQGEHAEERLRHHRHVDDDSIAFLHAFRDEHGGQRRNLVLQFAIGHVELRAGNGAVPGDRGLFAASRLDVPIDGVPAGVAHGIGIPSPPDPGVGIENLFGRLDPVDRDRGLPPERDRIASPCSIGLRIAAHVVLVLVMARSELASEPSRRECLVSIPVQMSFFDEGTFAFRERPRHFVSGDRGDGLVVVPGIFRFLGLLDLEKIGRQNAPPIDTQFGLSKQVVLDRNGLHLRDDGSAIVRIAAHHFERLEIVSCRGIDAGLSHRRHRVVRRAGLKCLRPGARLVVEVPVEGFRERQALGDFQTDAVDIVDEQKQRGQFFATGRDAEFGRLLDGVRRIAAGICQTNDFCLGRLRL